MSDDVFDQWYEQKAEIERLRKEAETSDNQIIRLSQDINRLREVNETLRTDLDRIISMHAETCGENERLAAIIANVCLALGYEESAWPTHWHAPPDPPKETG